MPGQGSKPLAHLRWPEMGDLAQAFAQSCFRPSCSAQVGSACVRKLKILPAGSSFTLTSLIADGYTSAVVSPATRMHHGAAQRAGAAASAACPKTCLGWCSRGGCGWYCPAAGLRPGLICRARHANACTASSSLGDPCRPRPGHAGKLATLLCLHAPRQTELAATLPRRKSPAELPLQLQALLPAAQPGVRPS